MAEEEKKKLPSIYGTGSLERLDTASTDLSKQLSSRPAQYENKYEGAINQAMDKVLNRQPFQYDVNGDALYKQYAEQYQRLGKQAMRDTIGQGAALTGGYDNSYAQNVGQQAYQGYMQQLTDKIPELYQLALDKYDRDATADEKKYALLTDRENQDYSRYNDNLSLWMTDRDYATDQYNTAFNQAMATGDALYNRLLALAQFGYTPTEDELAAMGMTAGQWNAYASQFAPKGGGGGGSGGGGGGGPTGGGLKQLLSDIDSTNASAQSKQYAKAEAVQMYSSNGYLPTSALRNTSTTKTTQETKKPGLPGR